MRDFILKFFAPEFVGKITKRITKFVFISDVQLAAERQTLSEESIKTRIAQLIANTLVEDGFIDLSVTYDQQYMGNQYKVSLDVIKNI